MSDINRHGKDGKPAGVQTVGIVLSTMLRHPYYLLIRRWNWKAAILSCLVRGPIFFVTNLLTDFDAAKQALLLEISFIAVSAGFYGAIMQAFRRARPAWVATLLVMGLLPVLNRLLELIIHSAGDTPMRKLSIFTSIAFSALSATFNLFAMRRGVLIVGRHQQAFSKDLRRLPTLVVSFFLVLPQAIWRLAKLSLHQIRHSPLLSAVPFVKPKNLPNQPTESFDCE